MGVGPVGGEGGEQLDRADRVRQQRDGLDPPQLLHVRVAERGQRVGQERDRGVQPGDHPDRGADVEPGDARLAGPGPPRELLPGGGLLPGRRGRRVSLDDPAGQPGLEPTPGQRPVHKPDHRRVHHPGRRHRQVPRLGRDQPRIRHPRLAGHQPGPDQRQPVPDIEGVRDQPPRGPRAHLHPGTQLRERELRHRTASRPHPPAPHAPAPATPAPNPPASHPNAGPRTPPPTRTTPPPHRSGPRADATPHPASPRRYRGPIALPAWRNSPSQHRHKPPRKQAETQNVEKLRDLRGVSSSEGCDVHPEAIV